MRDDPITTAAEEFGDWLHARLVEGCGRDTTPWVLEIVERVMSTLRPSLPSGEPPHVVVLLTQPLIAFTAPGRFIYISRRLLERCPGDPAVAFLIAHEVAHHQLGHLDLFAGVAKRLPRTSAPAIVAATYQLLVRHLYSPTNEAAADQRALELCLAAGFEGRHCLHLLEVLEDDALDHGDIDAVYGPEVASDPNALRSHAVRAWVWASSWLRGYLPLRQRLMNLRHQLGDAATWPGTSN